MKTLDAVLEVIRTRRSVRKFTDRRPSHAEIEQLIDAACWAPSSHNRQGWKFLVFEDADYLRNLAQQVREYVRAHADISNGTAAAHLDDIVYYAGLFEVAPVVLVAMHKQNLSIGRQMMAAASGAMVSGDALSTAMAVQNLCLAAHAMGMGTCVMAAPLLAGEIWRGLPDLPAGFEPTCLVALGYPAEQPDPPRRKEMKHVLEYR